MNPVKTAATRVDQVITMSKRATLGPTLVRATAAAAAFGGLLLAFPPGTLGTAAPVAFAVLALLPAVWPRGPMPTVVMLVTALGWLATGGDFDVKGTTFARMLAVAVLLYLVHTGSALAAVLPYDALVTRGLFAPWLIRGAIVLGLTGVLAVFVADLPDITHGRRGVIAAIGGILVTLAITGYLTLLGRRRTER